MATDTQLIKDKIDIVDFINEYVQLKPAGVNHKGLCPFHREKSPSFMVTRERQSWHCFGCNKGGDVFSFLQEIENMEFIEALRFLAGRAGVPLEEFKTEIDKSQKNRLKEINKEAARFFHNFLLKIAASEKAREYIAQRGLTAETVEEWKIGFVSDQWDLLTQYLLKKGFAIDDLVASGLTIKRDGADSRSGRGFYDRFRGRIMFPIWDIYGDVVGFTGRVLVETETSGGKYVNTPQSPIYDKSRVVFGLNKAKQEIKSAGRIVVVEGQMDVIACHQAGMRYVIATSGTAFTEEQIALLKRYSDNMYIAFDADAAGQAAAKRGIDLALAVGMHVKVITLPDGAGKDPDETIKKNKQIWFDAVNNATEIMNWYFAGSFKDANLQDPRSRQKIAESIIAEIIKIPYPIERDFWLHELSSRLGVGVDVLREQIDLTKKNLHKKQSALSRVVVPEEEISKEIVAKTKIDRVIERLCMLLLKFPTFATKEIFSLDETTLQSSNFWPIYEFFKSVYTTFGVLVTSTIRQNSPDNLKNSLEVLLLKAEQEFFDYQESTTGAEIASLVAEIREETRKTRRSELLGMIQNAEKKGEKELLEKLMKEFQNL
jgi:DNA primase